MEELTTPHDALPDAEVEMLADNMAATYAARQAYYRDKWNLDAEAAKKQAFGTPEKTQQIMTKPSSEITWNDIGVVKRNGPEGSHAQLWGRIKDDALAALDGGSCVRAATAERGPWSEAVCLAARARFMGEWKPRGGVEQVRAACARYREEQRARRRVTHLFQQRAKSLDETLRQIEALWQS